MLRVTNERRFSAAAWYYPIKITLRSCFHSVIVYTSYTLPAGHTLKNKTLRCRFVLYTTSWSNKQLLPPNTCNTFTQPLLVDVPLAPTFHEPPSVWSCRGKTYWPIVQGYQCNPYSKKNRPLKPVLAKTKFTRQFGKCRHFSSLILIRLYPGFSHLAIDQVNNRTKGVTLRDVVADSYDSGVWADHRTNVVCQVRECVVIVSDVSGFCFGGKRMY